MEKIKSEAPAVDAAAVDDAIAVTVDPRALHCPKCLQPLRPPVFQCAPCHGELPDKGKCESCFVPTKYTRCLAVERILRSIRVACPNARTNGGCSAKIMPGAGPSSVVKMGPCGGGGGAEDAWDMDMDVRGVMNRITSVVVHHEDAINAISVSRERDDGREEEQSKPWGTPFGKRSEICLDKDEYLTSVKGRYGQFDGWSVIRALTFVSNRRTFGPYGKAEGMEFQLPAASGGKIVGFHGRSGGLIGTYVSQHVLTVVNIF